MGVWGWDVIKDNQTLKGFVNNKPTLHDDGDWCFKVRPAHGFKGLLINPSFYTNSNGLVECEVEPPDDINGEDAESEATLNSHLADFKDNWVTVMGTWVRDRSHSITGQDIGVGGQQAYGKTEIHPIKWMLLERRPAPDNRSRVVEFFVFSDDSGGFPASVPHDDEDVVANLSIPIHAGSEMGSGVKFQRQVNKAKSAQLTVKDSGRFATFQATVASGKASEGKGFFHATVELPGFTLLTFILSRGVQPSIGVRELMSRAEVKSVRDLFNRLDAATLPTRECAKLADGIKVIKAQIKNVADQQDEIKKGGPENPLKPTKDPAYLELQKERDELEEKLKDLHDKGKKAGCLFD